MAACVPARAKGEDGRRLRGRAVYKGATHGIEWHSRITTSRNVNQPSRAKIMATCLIRQVSQPSISRIWDVTGVT